MGRALVGDRLNGAQAGTAGDPRALLFLTRPSAAPASAAVAEPLASLAHRLGLTAFTAAPVPPTDGETATAPIVLVLAGTSIILYPAAAAQAMVADGLLAAEPAGPDAAPVIVAALEMAAPLPPRGPERIIAAQRLCCVAAMLAAGLSATRIAWVPAALWSAAADLGDAIAAMEHEGLPPILHLIAFTLDAVPDAPRAALQSRGLAFFADCELRLDYPAQIAPADALRRLARLAIHVMLNGMPAPGLVVPGLVAGEQLRAVAWPDARADPLPTPPTITMLLEQH
jgi:hypothetical protein